MNPLPSPVPSPCVNICRMNPASGWCDGCWRTIDEIVAWGRLDDEGRRAVWVQLAQRRAEASTAVPASGPRVR